MIWVKIHKLIILLTKTNLQLINIGVGLVLDCRVTCLGWNERSFSNVQLKICKIRFATDLLSRIWNESDENGGVDFTKYVESY